MTNPDILDILDVLTEVVTPAMYLRRESYLRSLFVIW